ncbi:MAG: HIT family protein [Myxococcaceae bacterium]
MEHLWAPWRRDFVTGEKPEGCIFCRFFGECLSGDDRRNLVLGRTEHSFAVLNRFPYNNGHLMVVPKRHLGDFTQLTEAEMLDLNRLLQTAVRVVQAQYRPEGANLGMNLGADAGAGIVGHVHWHLVPRWRGDTNFMPVLAGTKVMVEHLDQTWEALRPRFDQALSA